MITKKQKILEKLKEGRELEEIRNLGKKEIEKRLDDYIKKQEKEFDPWKGKQIELFKKVLKNNKLL